MVRTRRVGAGKSVVSFDCFLPNTADSEHPPHTQEKFAQPASDPSSQSSLAQALGFNSPRCQNPEEQLR